ncbi:MAG: pectate lyase [Proteobacteria bacterium]|nr:pectate lyase [Pseudomonadota bacterium]
MTLPSALFCILLAGTVSAAGAGLSWYVAPTGDDAAPGTLAKPFATVQRAQQAAAAGDTVFLRGGTYAMREDQIASRKGIFASVMVLDKSGTPDQPITYRASPGERPVFDCSLVKPKDQRVSAFLVTGSWLHLQEIEVTGVQVTIKTHTQSICFESQGSHNVFERLALHDGQAIGIYHVRGASNLFLNCDAWNNWDYTSEDGKGGNVDGFGCHPTKGSTGNVFRGCRAWFNSDDGYDCISAQEAVTFEHCWAAYNGLSADGRRLADGNGFKAGGYGSAAANRLPKLFPRHTVRYCLAVRNKNSGFYANHHPGGCDWFNNSAYRNGTDFNLLGRLPDNRTEVDGSGHKLVNNLSYGSRRPLVAIAMSKCELAGNSFTLGLQLSDKDFITLDEAGLVQPRQPDGSLPLLQFLRPAAGSVLIEGGVLYGQSAKVPKPDIGALGR